jgi:DNA polymerase III sliding clamp (beta) subunit (PCNA family)
MKTTIDAVLLREQLSWVYKACAPKSEPRRILQCVQFLLRDQHLTLRATDGYRVHTAQVPVDAPAGEAEALIKHNAVLTLLSLLKDVKTTAAVSFRKTGFAVCADDQRLVVAPESSKFVTVSTIPLPQSQTVELDAQALNDVCRQAVKDKVDCILFQEEPETVYINPKFLLDALPKYGTVSVRTSSTYPTVIAYEQREAWVMPILKDNDRNY